MAPITTGQTFPHFLGIGAQKAGTSWVHECLKKHPEIWLPPEKELHYFDRSPEYASPTFLHPDQPILRLFGSDFWNQIYRNKCKDVFKDYFGKHPEIFRWYANYLFRTCSDAWYASLFEEGREKIRGEITPAYSILKESDVKHIHQLMPDARIIFILRNPIERAWSQYRFMVRQGKLKSNISFDEFKTWVDSPEQQGRSDYLKTIRIWAEVFSKDQLFIGFYDDIVSEPELLLSKILNFIGAASDGATVQQILEVDRVNVSPEIEIPAEFSSYLHEKYDDEVRLVAKQLGGPAECWHKEKLAK